MSVLIDLNKDSIRQYWKNSEHIASEFIEILERNEDWVVEDEKLRDALIKLFADIDKRRLEFVSEENQKELKLILAHMSSGDAFYLMSKVEEFVPGFTADMLIDALEKIEQKGSNDKSERVYRDRIVTAYRTNLICRVFSEVRIKAIKEALEITAEKHGVLYGD